MAQTYYLVVYLASATDPADDATGHGQIKNGQDGSGASAAFAGSTTWTGSPGQIDITGLSAGTLYGWAAVVYDDVALTYSNRVLGTETLTALGAGQASETDTAQAVGNSQALEAGQASETDAAQAVVASQLNAAGQASETDEALSASSGAVVPVGQVAEADEALAAAAAQLSDVGQASEVDEAQAAAYVAPGVTQQAAETDTALAVGSLQALAVGQASETDTAHAAVLAITAGLSLEIDVAQPVTAPAQALVVGQVFETDSALAVTAVSSGGTAGAAEVWGYVLSNGKTAEENVVEIHAMLTALTPSAIAQAVLDATV